VPDTVSVMYDAGVPWSTEMVDGGVHDGTGVVDGAASGPDMSMVARVDNRPRLCVRFKSARGFKDWVAPSAALRDMAERNIGRYIAQKPPEDCASYKAPDVEVLYYLSANELVETVQFVHYKPIERSGGQKKKYQYLSCIRPKALTSSEIEVYLDLFASRVLKPGPLHFNLLQPSGEPCPIAELERYLDQLRSQPPPPEFIREFGRPSSVATNR